MYGCRAGWVEVKARQRKWDCGAGPRDACQLCLVERSCMVDGRRYYGRTLARCNVKDGFEPTHGGPGPGGRIPENMLPTMSLWRRGQAAKLECPVTSKADEFAEPQGQRQSSASERRPARAKTRSSAVGQAATTAISRHRNRGPMDYHVRACRIRSNQARSSLHELTPGSRLQTGAC